MLIDQCTGSAVAHARTLGINTILNEHCDGLSSPKQLTMIQRTALAILPMKPRNLRGSGLMGWTFPDEPENNGWTPAALQRAHPYARGSADGLLSFVTTSGAFFRAPYKNAKVSTATFGKFARLADVAGFDLYPLGHCQHDLGAVYDAQRKFIQLAGNMPTFQWIETGPIKPTYCGGFTMTPEELNAEVWLAIVGGARGIGYFTHTWSPDHDAFNVSSALQRQIKKISAVLATVQPGLVSRTVPSGSNSGAIRIVARASNGLTYVFAVNTQRVYIKSQINVPHLPGGALTVVGEQRSVRATAGKFVDNFAPLAVHVYVQRR